MSSKTSNLQYAPVFWKPGDIAPGISIKQDRLEETDGATHNVVPFNSAVNLSMEQQRKRLPIFYYRNHLLHLLENHQVVIIQGETGCGKSTQVSQYLLESGWCDSGLGIAITQPRRVAAVMLATRVAEERGCLLGGEVGYIVRFDDCTSEQITKLVYLTDGMLVRKLMMDPLLSTYSVIILDECHERTVQTDITLGLLKKVLKKRPELRIVVSSATIDAETFLEFFDPDKTGSAVGLSVEGRQHPVKILHTQVPVPDYVQATIDTVIAVHRSEPPGDILAFVTGQDEIKSVCEALSEYMPGKKFLKLEAVPLHGSLPAAEQRLAFRHPAPGTRKVVVSTNIAETSVTIPGIVYVIDCGFVKLQVLSPRTGLESVVKVAVSQAMANQRCGRAGRLRDGKCFRLYPQHQFDRLTPDSVPEFQRRSLVFPLLQLKALGVKNLARFDFISAPPSEVFIRSLDSLHSLGVLDDTGELTQSLGFQMAEFPLEPQFSRTLLASAEFKCSQEVLAICSMVQVQNVFLCPKGKKAEALNRHKLFMSQEGDLLTMLNVYVEFGSRSDKLARRFCQENFLNHSALVRAKQIYGQLARMLRRFQVDIVSCDGDEVPILRCLVVGFHGNAARLNGTGTYETINGGFPLSLHPQSVMQFVDKLPPCVIFLTTSITTQEYMRDVSVIRPEWLTELAGHYYSFGTERELHERALPSDKK